MLRYNGKLYFDTPLSEEEITFLTQWQEMLVANYEDYRKAPSKEEKEQISKELNYQCGIEFDEKQRWAITFAMNPMIHFHKDYIELSGIHMKGNMREAFMAYHHFFLGENAVLKECMKLDYFKPHTFKGIVEAWREDPKTQKITRWCYIVDDNHQVTSVEAPSIKEYEKNPSKWKITIKEDTFYNKLKEYFPPLMQYASIRKSINKENAEKKEPTKPTRKIKI